MVSLVNTLLLATRRMMRSNAMTYSIRRRISQPARRSMLWESANLSLSDDSREYIPSGDSDTGQPNDQQRVHSVEGQGRASRNTPLYHSNVQLTTLRQKLEMTQRVVAGQPHGEGDLATIELERKPGLDTWAGERSIERRVN